MTDGPRLLGRREAAEYCGIAPGTFSLWVAAHKMPPAIPGTRKWDRKAIDAKLDEISGLAPLQTRTGLPADEHRGLEWWREQDKKRDKHKPIHNLDAREERVLRYMIAHPEYSTTDAIPQAGEKTMERLTRVGVVRPGGKDHQGQRQWFVTEEGRAEIKRTDTWKNWKF